ncbi:MAG TPA: PAS domain S-box protein [Bradyrhizobium sp.]|nr:PAS domain S-box protein [Bradyrhizobium sp.]
MADDSLPMFIRRFADKHPHAFSYGSAVVISVAALVIVLILPYHRQQPVLLFFELGVALATWVGGWRAGVVALIGGTIASAYFTLQNIGTPVVFRMVLNLVYTVGIIWVVANLRFSQQALRQSEEKFRRLNSELERRVAERTAQLQAANEEQRYYVQLLQTVTDNASSALYMVDSAGLGTFVNPALERITGYRAHELIGHVVHDKIHHTRPDGSPYPVHECPLTGAVRHRKTLCGEDLFLRKDGTFFPVQYTASPIFRGDIAAGTVIEVQDLTEAKAVERALQDSEELKRRIIESSRDCIKLLDLDGNLLFMSSGGQRLLEIDNIDAYLNSCWIDFWQPEDRPMIRESVAAARAGGIGTFQAFCPSAKGAPRWWDVITAPICNADGQPEQLLSVSRDITERKRAEAKGHEIERRHREMQTELAHAARIATMGQLTASIAHEIRQPLSGVQARGTAALMWLTKSPPGIEEAKQSIDSIVKDINRANDVIGRIRNLAKKSAPKRDTIDINGTILEVIELTRTESVKHDVTVQMRLEDNLPPVQGDKVQLQQVMINLIINAIDAMSGGTDGTRALLIVTGKAEAGNVLVAVGDSGPGLAPGTAEQLFDAFYTTKPSGIGLGLSISRSIIDDHGGRLWASANEPRGAIFQFTLPALAVSP